MATYTETHYLTVDTDRCACGGEWVYFDLEDSYGCESAGPPTYVVLDGDGPVVPEVDDYFAFGDPR
jgi:hypothetical protein